MAKKKSGEGTLYKRGGVYHLQYYINGKRRQKSTKTGDYREAQRVAREIIAAAKGTQDISDVVKNAAIDKGIVDSDKLNQIETSVAKTAERVIKVSASWQRYFDSSDRLDSGESTLKEYERYWEAFTDWTKCEYLHEVTAEDARAFARKLQTGDLSPDNNKKIISSSTYNKYINFCKRCFNTLSYEAGISSNPFAGIAVRYDKDKEDRTKDSLTKEQLDSIYTAIDTLKELELIQAEKMTTKFIYRYRGSLKENISQGQAKQQSLELCENKWNEIRLLFIIGIYTGLRLKDAVLLKWVQVNFEGGRISLPPAKTKRKGSAKWVQLPLVTRLSQELKKQDEKCEYVLPYLSGRYLADRASITKVCKQVFEQAGIKTTKDNGDGKAISVVGFHSLRHTFVSECAKAGIPLAVVQSIVGHGSPAMTRHYTHIDVETARKGIEKIGTKRETAEDKLEKVRELVLKLTKKNAETIQKEVLRILEARN